MDCNNNNNKVAWLLLCIVSLAASADATDFDVRSYGVKADGKSDDSEAINKAWIDACNATVPSKLLVPKGKYMVGPLTFHGPCNNPILVDLLEAKFIAPVKINNNKVASQWVLFEQIDGLTVYGGDFDGRGSESWKINDCKKHFNGNCKLLPYNLNFAALTNSKVKGLTSIDSKFFHMNIIQCKNLTLSFISITAPGDSPNTDGIHIGRSKEITIDMADIKTGDDCISLGDGSENVTIGHVECGPGHGISIGSLGKYPNEQPVKDITVKHCKLTNTDNGVRIKTWPASPEGLASGMHFEDITMNNVSNPILIDQQYCPWNQCKAGVPSRVKINDVSFKNIKGTSATKVAVKLACSPGIGCEQVDVKDVFLQYHGTNGSAISECQNVNPSLSGTLYPPICAPGQA